MSHVLSGQLVDDFDDMSFPNDPLWQGHVSDFKVNEDLELQLDTEGGGVSVIYSEMTLPDDTISFSFKFRLDFDPSGSNQLRVYLAADGLPETDPSGYYLELGETGGNDAIRIYYLDGGVGTEIAVASFGAVAESPDVNLKIVVYPDGLWVLNVDYTGGTFLEEDLVFMHDQFSMSDAQYFVIAANYTSSRSDLFFFDDINIDRFQQDKSPPTVVAANIINNNQIEVSFSEPVLSMSSENEGNYTLDNGVHPSSVSSTNPTRAILTFDESFAADRSFSLTIDGISDLLENEMITAQVFELSFARAPIKGNIIINELLFAPIVGGEDYVEIRNLTEDFLDLSGLVLGNSTKTEGDIKPIKEGTKIGPQEYLVFTEEKDTVIGQYNLSNGDQIIEQSIPSFNNDMGNVFIATSDTSIIYDSYNYDEDQHFELLVLVKGVSLERTSPFADTNDADTWTSASRDVNFGTPGYKNSAARSENIEIVDNFTFIEKVFSPDGDGDKDVMILGYSLEKSGYTATIEIRDVGGFLIKTIKSNETLSTSGVITWNGIDMEGKLANIGMYIVSGEVFHSDGEVIGIKKVCVLAGKY